MSQYQRLISYLYRYEEDEKKNNVGYVRIELRGDACRITVQMRDFISGVLPDVAFFRQEPEGAQEIPASRLKKNGSGFGCRIETHAGNMVNSGYSFSDLDGLVIFINSNVYYATTWKDVNVSFNHTDVRGSLEAAGEEQVETAGDEQLASNGTEAGEWRNKSEQAQVEADGEVSEEAGRESQHMDIIQDGDAASSNNVIHINQMGDDKKTTEQDVQAQQTDVGSESKDVLESKDKGAVAACQYEACCQCPQRGRMGDFGSHIIAMFPRMYPFEIESMRECVRLELKDIGCLPVPYWSLSGNPFLLHGYYSYRHILFAKMADGGYYIGVPGIYNRENEKQAKSCGFQEFNPLSEVADLQGAFGYWMFPVMA